MYYDNHRSFMYLLLYITMYPHHMSTSPPPHTHTTNTMVGTTLYNCTQNPSQLGPPLTNTILLPQSHILSTLYFQTNNHITFSNNSQVHQTVVNFVIAIVEIIPF